MPIKHIPPATPDQTTEGVARQVKFALDTLFGVPEGPNKSPGLAIMFATPDKVKAYREFRKNILPQLISRTGSAEKGSPAFEEMLSHLLRGNWFHGTPQGDAQKLLKMGFDPKRTSLANDIRFGEPSGYSITNNPAVARGFGGDTVVRIQPQVARSEILVPSLTTEDKVMESPLTKAYIAAMKNSKVDTSSPFYRVDSGSDWLKYERNAANQLEDRLGRRGEIGMDEFVANWLDLFTKNYEKVFGNRDPGNVVLQAFRALRDMHPRIPTAFNDALSADLMKQGFQAILHNPKRYGEFEMRMLNRERAVPLDLRSKYQILNPEGFKYPPSYARQTKGTSLPDRYTHTKEIQTGQFWQLPEFNEPGRVEHLQEIYRKIPLDKLFNMND